MRDPEALETIEAMDPSKVDGVDTTNRLEGEHSLLNGVSEDPNLAERLQTHLDKSRPQLEAFTAGVARPEFQWDYDAKNGLVAAAKTPFKNLAEIADAILVTLRSTLICPAIPHPSLPPQSLSSKKY